MSETMRDLVLPQVGDYNTPQDGTVLWNPGADKRIVLLGFFISTAAAGAITLKVSDNFPLIGPVYLNASGCAGYRPSEDTPLAVLDRGQTITVDSDMTAKHSINLFGAVEKV